MHSAADSLLPHPPQLVSSLLIPLVHALPPRCMHHPPSVPLHPYSPPPMLSFPATPSPLCMCTPLGSSSHFCALPTPTFLGRCMCTSPPLPHIAPRPVPQFPATLPYASHRHALATCAAAPLLRPTPHDAPHCTFLCCGPCNQAGRRRQVAFAFSRLQSVYPQRKSRHRPLCNRARGCSHFISKGRSRNMRP